eukprot:31336-Pelagococcus_subviridis.AAC.10
MHPRFAHSSAALALDSATPLVRARSASTPNARNAFASPPNDRTVRTLPSVAAADALTAPCAFASIANSAPVLRLNFAVTIAKDITANASTGASLGATANNTTTVPTHSHAARNPRSRLALATTSVRTVPSSTDNSAASSADLCSSKKRTRCVRSARKRSRRNDATTSSPSAHAHRT